MLSDQGIENQVPMAFQRFQQARQDDFQELAADTVGLFPHHHKRLASRFSIGSPANCRSLNGACRSAAQETDRVLPVAAHNHYKFVENLALLPPVCLLLSLANYGEKFKPLPGC
jgi:hypothetical protein